MKDDVNSWALREWRARGKRSIADDEEQAYREDERREFDRRQKAKRDRAAALGYAGPNLDDPAFPSVCPTCGASVTLSAVERHTAWHEEQSS